MTSSLLTCFRVCLSIVIFIQPAKFYNLDGRSGSMNIFLINPDIGNGESPAYAGYNFFATRTNDQLSLIAGAPRYAATTGQQENGAIFQCLADVKNNESSSDWLSNITCQVTLDDSSLTIGTSQRQTADFLGTTLLVHSKNIFTVCAPGREKQCGDAGTYLPGACYHGSLNDSIRLLQGWGEIRCFQTFLDIVFVLDSSTSIGVQEFETMKRVLIDVSNVFANSISSTTQIGLLQYYHRLHRGTPVFNYARPATLGSCRNIKCIQDAILLNMTHLRSPDTYTADAIRKAVEVDFANSNNKDVSTKIIILITDGDATDSDKLIDSYQLTQANNITVYALGVGNDINQAHLRESANGGTSDDRVLTTSDYHTLSEELQNLTRVISSQAGAEVSSGSENTLENAQIGLSGHVTDKTGEIFLGAVGAYSWSGTVVKYSAPDAPTAKVPDFAAIKSVFKNDSENSYLGYSMTSGYYDGGEDLYVAVSAPRYVFAGAVLVYNSTMDSAHYRNHHVLQFNASTNRTSSYYQLGSYFGGSLLSIDINGDGKDDLLIGAPLFTSGYYDEGRVFMYVTNNSTTSSPARWSDQIYRPDALYGEDSPGGRFGTSMASAKDINGDGYNDVIIGAPFVDNDKGAIYVYLGGVDGINKEFPPQKISASASVDSSIVSFGHFIQGGIDVDGNSYPDVLVGAPWNDTVFLIRTRPIVELNATLTFEPNEVEVMTCFTRSPRDCLKLRACFTANGTSIEDAVEVSFNITLDNSLKRIEFRREANVSTSGSPMLMEDLLVRPGSATCKTYQVFVKIMVDDTVARLQAEMTYGLSERHNNRPLSSIQSPFIQSKVEAHADFMRGCRVNHQCVYDLVLAASMRLPTVVLVKPGGERVDLSNAGQTLVVAAETINQPITVRVNLSNSGENAYRGGVVVTYPTALSWSQVFSVTGSVPGHSACIMDRGLGIDKDNRKMKTVLYRHLHNLGNIMPPGAWCSFYFNLTYSNLRFNGDDEVVKLNVEANVTNNDYDKERDASNNQHSFDIPVKYRSDATISRAEAVSVMTFNLTIPTRFVPSSSKIVEIPKESSDRFNQEKTWTRNIQSISQIGGTNGKATVQYDIKNLGFSRISNSSLSLKYPSFLTPTQPLLYLYQLDCSPVEGSGSCSCDNSLVNIFNLSLSAHDVGASSVIVHPNPHPLEESGFNCNATYLPRYCHQLMCYVTNFNPNSVIRFRALFKLWSPTFVFKENVTEVSLKSEFTYSTRDSPQVVDKFGGSIFLSYKTNTIARLYTSTVIVIPHNIYLLNIQGLFGGLVVATLFLLVARKSGFLKSRFERYVEKYNRSSGEEDDGKAKQSTSDLDAKSAYVSGGAEDRTMDSDGRAAGGEYDSAKKSIYEK